MQWTYLLLILSGCFAGSISLYLYLKIDRLKYLGLLTACFFFVLIELAHIFEPVFTGNAGYFIIKHTIEWGQIFCLACILCTLLIFIRESKPEFSRFPIIYVIFPVLIILSYLLVYNTIMLKVWLMELYKGGAAVAAVLIYGIYYYRQPIYRLTLTGALLFLVTYGLTLILPKSYKLVSQILLIASICSLFSGYYIVERPHILELQKN